MRWRWLAGTALAGLLATTANGTLRAQDLATGDAFVFGDSLSDTGSGFAATGGRSNPFGQNVQPNGALYNTAFPQSLQNPAAGQPTARFSNGEIHIDALAGDLTNVVGPFDAAGNAQPIPGTGLTAPVDVNPNQTFAPGETGPDGFNFAHGGAQSGQTDDQGRQVGFLSQVEAFTTLRQSGRLAADGNDTAVVFVGGNDFFSAARNGSLGEQTVANALQNVGTGLRTLAGSGVENVVVYNLPNLRQVPLAQEIAQQAPTQQQRQQLLTGFEQLSAAFNQQLETQVAGQLRQQGTNVRVVDMAALFRDIARQPGAYGLRDGRTHCFSLVSQQPTGDCQSAEDVQSTTFLDSLHPTAASQQIIAEFAQGSLFTRRTAAQVYANLPKLALVAVDGHNRIIESRLREVRAGMRGHGFMGQQLAAADPDAAAGTASGHSSQLSVFAYGTHNSGDRPADDNRAGFDYDQQLAALGVDYEINDSVLLGAAAGYSNSDADIGNGLGNAEIESTLISLYGMAEVGGFYGDLTGTVSLDNHTLDRRTAGPLGRAEAEADGQTFSVALHGGYSFRYGPLRFGPTAGVRWLDAEIEEFNEADAGALNLDVGDLNGKAVIGSFGAQAAARFDVSESVSLAPQIGLSYEHDFKNQSLDVVTTLPGNRQFGSSADISRADTVVLDGGVTLGTAFGVSASLGGQVSLDGNGSDHGVRGRLRYTF